MVLKIILLASIILTCPTMFNWCVGAGYVSAREQDGNVMEVMDMDFVSHWKVEGMPVTCLEEERVPTWNGAEMDAYLLDGVYYRRCSTMKIEPIARWDDAEITVTWNKGDL